MILQIRNGIFSNQTRLSLMPLPPPPTKMNYDQASLTPHHISLIPFWNTSWLFFKTNHPMLGTQWWVSKRKTHGCMVVVVAIVRRSRPRPRNSSSSARSPQGLALIFCLSSHINHLMRLPCLWLECFFHGSRDAPNTDVLAIWVACMYGGIALC